MVRQVLLSLKEKFKALENTKIVRAVDRLGEVEEFWDLVDDPVISLLDDLITANADPGEDAETWSSPIAPLLLSFVRFGRARQNLKDLETRFTELTGRHLADVLAVKPHPYFASRVPDVLRGSWNFELAETATAESVIPNGKFLNVDELEESLDSWATNTQCREARRMESLAVGFYGSTIHLRGADTELWRTFLVEVRSRKEFYERRYVQLELAMAADGLA